MSAGNPASEKPRKKRRKNLQWCVDHDFVWIHPGSIANGTISFLSKGGSRVFANVSYYIFIHIYLFSQSNAS